ncbi:protein NLRC3-like isoform X2 [Montipora capricornis]|uniref:protein NLRC3-like isoform X2 n=1 Tax=Montipora capricornis TaxID=246305 RepID=UPI0035F18876
MPPKLRDKPPKLSDLPGASKPLENADLPIDILLLTVEDCEFLSCFSFLDRPFKRYKKDVGPIYFGYTGNNGDQEKLKVALMKCSKGAAVPGGSLTAVKNAVRVLSPKAVFSVGTCSGLSSDKVKLGDVVVSAKLTTAAGFKSPVSRHMSDLVRDASYGWVAPLENPDELEVEVHCDGDILSQTQAARCGCADLHLQYPEAIAVETEGEGVFAAAYDEKIEWVVVKGVAHFVNQTELSRSEWMSFASTMAASVVAKMLNDPVVFQEWPHCNQDASCEPQMPSEPQGKLKRKCDISFTDHGLSQKKAREEEKESKEHADEQSEVLFTSESSPSSSLASYRTKDSCSSQSHITEWIRQIYQKREGVVFPVPWCEGFSFQIENIFTRLKIVAKEKTRGTLAKEITNMTSIFTSHEDCQHPRIVLIEGEPGMGKTTYCQKLAYDWATKQDCEWDESFPKVEVLLLLRCREIESSIWEAIDDQILPEEIDPELKETFSRFVQENSSKVLLVLDGLDEADPQKLALYFSLVQRKLLPGCHIVLTSRHEAGNKVRPYSDTLLEIVGFTRSDAKCFIRKYFRHAEQMAEKLINDVEGPLAELTKNPLNTLLLCVLFEDFGGILPNNRTQLYVEIVLFVLRRYEMKNHLPSSGKDLLIVYKKELMILGRMAQESLFKGEGHFEDVHGNFKESLFIKFGFLSIQAGGSKRTPCFRYSFFHKSFQEFFSGLHLAFSILAGEIDKESVLTDERYFRELNQVFMFMSGIIASQSEETAVSIVNGVASLVNVRVRRSAHDANLYLKLALDVIGECKTCSENLYTTLAYTFGKSLDLTEIRIYFESRTSIPALSQALAVNTSLTSLDLSQNSIGAEGGTSLSQALAVNTSLTTLDLSDSSIGADGVTSISQALAVNTSLTTLDMSHNSIGAEGATSLSQALAVNTSLTTLNLSANFIGAKAATSLSQALAVNTSLTTLNLSVNSIDAEGVTSLFQALAVNTSLTALGLSGNFISDEGAASLSQALAVNTSLTTLDLSSNSIGAEGATSLSQALAVNTSLTTLHLFSNSIGAEGATSLSQALAVNTSLTTLDLSWNSIGAEGATSLSQALAVNTSLTTLDLSHNYIGDAGATSLSQALAVNTSLTTLDLSQNSISAEGATSLSQALAVNTSLTTLDLSQNSISAEGATSLSQALAVNTSLTTLDLSQNSISAEGATSLSQALAVNTSLTTLDLSQNSISAEGATSLSQALAVNTSLTTLYLSRNSIRAEGATSFSQALAVNTSLTTLYLSQNSISAEGATSLSQALAVNTSLTTLDLSVNSIGAEGATSLSQALAVNTSLTTLDLSLNSIGAEGATSLSQALAVNTSLTTLDLSDNLSVAPPLSFDSHMKLVSVFQCERRRQQDHDSQ